MMDADTNQSGAKRNTGGSRMSGTVNAPAFGMSIPSSVYPKDSVKDVAESLGITNLRENVAVALAADIEYRIRDIAQSASKYMRHSKRTQMTTADVDAALREKNVEPLYGFFPPYTTGRSKGPWFRSVQSASGQPLQVMEESVGCLYAGLAILRCAPDFAFEMKSAREKPCVAAVSSRILRTLS